jgi:hypothetical protein
MERRGRPRVDSASPTARVARGAGDPDRFGHRQVLDAACAEITVDGTLSGRHDRLDWALALARDYAAE